MKKLNNFNIWFLDRNIWFKLNIIESNSKRGGDQSQLFKEVLDIIHNNDTAVAKAKSFLEIVEREIARSHDKKDNDDISGRADEFGNNGINLFLLSLDTLYAGWNRF